MKLPAAIERTPELDRWIHINADGSITVKTGKVEIGQGITTAIAMIAAEELDVSVERIVVQTADTEITPNEFVTAGSMSVEDSGSAVRVAGAAARQIILAKAAEALGVDYETLDVEDGLVTSSDSNEQSDYWSLQGGERFEVEIRDVPLLKDPHGYTIVGRKHRRVDLWPKVRGDVAFVHDMILPHMRHGRLVKPPLSGAVLSECPESLDMVGVELVRDGSFVGVVADREEFAAAAADRLSAACRWEAKALATLPAHIPAFLREHVGRSLPVVDGTPVDKPVPEHQPPQEAAVTIESTYYRPFQMHGAVGPSAAVARFMNGVLTVYSHSQGVELLKLALADALDLSPDQVHVIHAEGAGCYGHNGADDVAMDAALLAMWVEPDPVKVKWTRSDEHGFEPFGPAALIDMQGSVDEAGRIIDWRHEAYSFSHAGRPRPTRRDSTTAGRTNLQSAWWRKDAKSSVPRQPALFPEVGIHRNMEPIYAFPHKQLVKHFVPDSPLRTSSLRSLGAFANVFAIESFMDELACASSIDPFEFRLNHLEDERARILLSVLREKAPVYPVGGDAGRGIALARYKNRQTYCAVMVDLHVTDDAVVHLDRAVIVADAGLVIDPDGLINQLEGGFIQAASWALKEEVVWDSDGVTSRDWDSYPILRFSEVPVVETHLVDRPLERALGAGEASTGPTPAAIANAIHDAVGLRLRVIPFTPDKLKHAAAGANPERS